MFCSVVNTRTCVSIMLTAAGFEAAVGAAAVERFR